VARAVLGNLSPREAVALRSSIQTAPRIAAELRELPSSMLREIASIDLIPELRKELERVLESDPPQSLKEGGIIREGVSEELDHHRSLARDSRKHILELETRERDATGIGSLKIRYNRVFGYYLEVTRANQSLVPDRYIRKQTLVNSERYITEELKELEEKILAAESELVRLEREQFQRIQDLVVAEATRLRDLAREVATLDVLSSFAEVAAKGAYVRPRVLPLGEPIQITGGRHPVVETMIDEEFIPNDTDLGSTSQQIVILTGPNMGGKSTYLRQIGLIVLMAQIGSFVPAEDAKMGSVDRIFSRVGASDDLSRGESTFMVEMIETARILHQATSNSLVILDEVGRGTATFDGLSLAWAIVEHLHASSRPKTLFATHYHELTELAVTLDGVVNRTLAVKEWQDKIVFLRRVIPGASDKSYGLHVARLAGIPDSVIERAGQILSNLEAQEYDMRGRPRIARGASDQQGSPDQLGLFAPAEEIVTALLREVDVEQLSPLAALNLLNALKSRLDEL
jgi:DNA mismatch repair protein MutS